MILAGQTSWIVFGGNILIVSGIYGDKASTVLNCVTITIIAVTINIIENILFSDTKHSDHIFPSL